MDKLYIVGYGPGGEKLLTETAKNIINTSHRIISTGRLCQWIADKRNVKSCTLAELRMELCNKINGDTAVLVSGDCGFFSLSKSIVKDFSEQYQIELINGISCVQYFSAKIAVSYDDAVIISMHGRKISAARIIPKVAYNRKVFVLTGGIHKAHNICAELSRCGMSWVRVLIGERLSYSDERIVEGTAGELMNLVFGDLSVMYIENASYHNPFVALSDSDFIRGEIPMTKEEVRWLSIHKLGIMPTDIIYDIGAGTGSVSVEMAWKAVDGFVYAVEMKDTACDLITRNKIKHGAYNLEVINGKAPEALEALPHPDKAFIGGSSGCITEILDVLLRKNPFVKVVSTAVSLQGLHQIMEVYSKAGFSDIDTICVNISKSRKVNNYDLMMAQNPVYILRGERQKPGFTTPDI